MDQRPTAQANYPIRGSSSDDRASYVVFCGGVVVAVVLLTLTGFILPPRKLQSAELPDRSVPTAMIQLMPDRTGLCRHIVFHNETGRFEEGGKGTCRDLSPERQIADETRNANRTNALGRAFKFR